MPPPPLCHPSRAATGARVGTAASAFVSTLVVSALGLSMAACSGVLSQREVVVHFVAGTSVSVRTAVLARCGPLPQVSPEPLPTSSRDPATRLGEIRFRVDDANNQELNRLLQCLQGFPEVTTYDLPQEGI